MKYFFGHLGAAEWAKNTTAAKVDTVNSQQTQGNMGI